MRILALAAFDPASVVLSHRDLMRAAGHDFRLAVVRAYTERQRQADYVCEQLVSESRVVAPGVTKKWVTFEKLAPNLEELREFAKQADVIQFHPGIGQGSGDWASQDGPAWNVNLELLLVEDALGLRGVTYGGKSLVFFFHGSRATWASRDWYKGLGHPNTAASTIDYAHEFDAAYLPPFVDVGDLRAPLRGDDDPLLIAHTPTDRAACSTEEFLAAARGLGIPVRLGEGLTHKQVLALKAECNAGFDHLRGAFSVNTLENAALGLVPIHAMRHEYNSRLLNEESIGQIPPFSVAGGEDMRRKMRRLGDRPAFTRKLQVLARSWWEEYFSAEPITKRLTKFYASL